MCVAHYTLWKHSRLRTLYPHIFWHGLFKKGGLWIRDPPVWHLIRINDLEENSLPHAKVIKKLRINVRGIIQGVGFRPFVYKLATGHGLKGWVCNTSDDVTIEVEGLMSAISHFLERLKTQAPPRSQIEDIKCQYLPPFGYETFEIRGSLSLEGRYQLISPDIATCPLCQEELFDPGDRRFLHPFINCTNCGPRFTIIEDIPYDLNSL